jgi:hypothetical protein
MPAGNFADVPLVDRNGVEGRGSGGASPYVVRLYLPGGRGSCGFLDFERGGGPWLVVAMTPKLYRPLLALLEALKKDARAPEPARGWRTASQISAAVAAMDPHAIPVEPGTMRSYLAQLVKAIAEAAEEKGICNPPDVIDRRRNLGARLVVPDIEVVDGEGLTA